MTQHYHSTMYAQQVRHSRSAVPTKQENNLLKALILTALAYLIFIENPSITLSLNPLSGRAAAEKDPLAGVIVPVTSKAKVKESRHQTSSTFSVAGAAVARNESQHKVLQSRNEKFRDYIDRFRPIAKAEQQKYGIPASIILAQALIESNAGTSRLAQQANNHFGIKCFSQHCKRGHCMNYSDDTHKDFFVKYNNIWGSYRAHSQFLRNSARYRKLFKLPAYDYRGWARGLENTGYATNKSYAEQLISVIERFGLNK